MAARLIYLDGIPSAKRLWFRKGLFCLVSALIAAVVPGLSGALASSPETVVAGNTAFAVDLFQRERQSGANLFFSPYSISTALAMTYAGARGKTEQEMAQALHFSLPAAELSAGFARLNDRFEQIQHDKKISLNVANSLWHDRNVRFLETFLKLSRDNFHAEIQPADFRGNPEGARTEINTWVEKQTQDKIRDLLHPGQISSSTRLVLCNAIYFKGTWIKQFNPGDTRPEPFFLAADRTVDVPMMSGKMMVRTHRLDAATVFALPYVGNDLSMVLLLPNETDGLSALEPKLNGADLQQWLAALAQAPREEATIFLPKFKLDRRLDLAGELAAMGMRSAFDPAADFSGMTASDKLFIDGVVHQAFVDVNEQGTEAAAATAVTVKAASISRTVTLRVDHPFLFFIVEQSTGTVLFLGRVMDPSK